MTARDEDQRPVGRREVVLEAWIPAAGAHEVRVVAGQVVSLPDDDHLLAVLAGERRPPGTRIELAGRRVDRSGPATRVRRGFAVVRGIEVADDVTVRDHLAATVGVRGARSLLAAAPLLASRGDDPAGVLSGGERRVLTWLQAQAAQPRAVLLDRAGTGLDATALSWAHAAVDRWLDGGVAVLLRPGRREEAGWLTHRADGRPRAASGRV